MIILAIIMDYYLGSILGLHYAHESNASHLYRGILLISKIAVPTTYFTILIIIEYSKRFII